MTPPCPTPEQDLLASIHLYVKWRWVTKQLTTEQKELWADAVDAHGAWLAATEPGWGPAYRVPRWWRDDYVPDSDEKLEDPDG